MDKIEEKLRDALREGLDDLEVSSGGPDRLVRTARVRRYGLATMAVLIATVTAVAGFSASQALLTSSDRVVRPAGDSQADGPQNPNRPVTRKVTVASGRRDGHEWSMFAYRAVAQGAAAEEAGFAGRESLCWGMDFGSHEGEPGCFVGMQEPMAGDDHMYVLSNLTPRSTTAFFGKVSSEVERVEIDLEGAGTTPARIIDAPDELGVSFDFFVGFAPPSKDVVLVATDAAGDTLESQVFEALPVLKVALDGDGSGTVTGYRTEERTQPEAEPLVDCGRVCEVELSDVRVTLEATPAVGSVFLGWGGGCDGVAPCDVRVDNDVTVRAIFERVP